MSGEIGGWNVSGSAASGSVATAQKPALSQKQHIIYSISASFLAAPAGGILCQIVDPDVSPNTVLWEGYFGGAVDPPERTFPRGICAPIGHSVAAYLANASTTAKVEMHGMTR